MINELRKVIREYIITEIAGNPFWIDRFGERLDVKNVHIQTLAANPERFFTPRQLEEIRPASQPFDRGMARMHDHLAFRNGAVRVRTNLSGIWNIDGTRKAIKENLAKLLSDNASTKYVVNVKNKDGEGTADTFQFRSVEEFMEEFSDSRSRRGGHTSKVSRFR